MCCGTAFLFYDTWLDVHKTVLSVFKITFWPYVNIQLLDTLS